MLSKVNPQVRVNGYMLEVAFLVIIMMLLIWVLDCVRGIELNCFLIIAIVLYEKLQRWPSHNYIDLAVEGRVIIQSHEACLAVYELLHSSNATLNDL